MNLVEMESGDQESRSMPDDEGVEALSEVAPFSNVGSSRRRA